MACSPTPASTQYETQYETSSYISQVTQVTISAEVHTPTETVTLSIQVCKGGENGGRGAKGNVAWRTRTEGSLGSRAVPTAPPSSAKERQLGARDEGKWGNGWKGVTKWAGSVLSDMHDRHGSPTRGSAEEDTSESNTSGRGTSTTRPSDAECTWSTYTTTSLAEPTTIWKTRTVESAKIVTTEVAVKTLYAECPATSTSTRTPLKAAETTPAQRTKTAAQEPATDTMASSSSSDRVVAMSAQATDYSPTIDNTEASPTTRSPATTLVASTTADLQAAAPSPSAPSDTTSDSARLPAAAGTPLISNAVPSQVSPAQSNSENTSSRQVNAGAVVGGVLGALVLLGLLVCFVRAYSKHKRTKRAETLRSTWFSSAYEDHDNDEGGHREKAASQTYSRFSAPSVAHMDTGPQSRLSNGIFARTAPAYVTDPLTRMSSERFPALGTVTQKIRQSLHLGRIDHGWVRKFSDTSSAPDHSGRAFPAAAHVGVRSALSLQQSIEELDTPSSRSNFGEPSAASGGRTAATPAAVGGIYHDGGMRQPRAYDSDGQPRSVHWGHSYSPPGSRDLGAVAAGRRSHAYAARHASEAYTVDEEDGEIISFSPNHPFSAAAAGPRESIISGGSGGTAAPRTLIPARAPQITYEPAHTGSSLFEYEHIFTGMHAAQAGGGGGGIRAHLGTVDRRVSAATTVTLARSIASDTQRETRHWYDKPYWDRQINGLSAGSALSTLTTTMPRQPAGHADTSPRSQEFSPYGLAL